MRDGFLVTYKRKDKINKRLTQQNRAKIPQTFRKMLHSTTTKYRRS